MSFLKSFLSTFNFFLYEVGGQPVISWIVLSCFAAFLIRLLIKQNRQKEKNESEDEEAEPTKKKTVPKRGPIVLWKSLSKETRKRLMVGFSILLVVTLLWMYGDKLLSMVGLLDFNLSAIQLPDFRFSNAAFWVFFPIVLLSGFCALSSNRKKALRVPLILFLGMLLVFWHFDVPILLMADRDGEEYGYNPMDFEPAVELLLIEGMTIQISAKTDSWKLIGHGSGRLVLLTTDQIDIGGYIVNADGQSPNPRRPMIPADHTNTIYQRYDCRIPFGALAFLIEGQCRVVSGKHYVVPAGTLVYGSRIVVEGESYIIKAMVSDSYYSDNSRVYHITASIR